MSGKTAADYCEAIEGEFAWFSQLCMKRAVTTVLGFDGDEFGACADHATTPPLAGDATDEES